LLFARERRGALAKRLDWRWTIRTSSSGLTSRRPTTSVTATRCFFSVTVTRCFDLVADFHMRVTNASISSRSSTFSSLGSTFFLELNFRRLGMGHCIPQVSLDSHRPLRTHKKCRDHLDDRSLPISQVLCILLTPRYAKWRNS
jgi:hypothetical protein